MAESVAELVVRFSADPTDVQAGVKIAGTSLKMLGGASEDVSNKLKGVGDAMKRAGNEAIRGAGGTQQAASAAEAYVQQLVRLSGGLLSGTNAANLKNTATGEAIALDRAAALAVDALAKEQAELSAVAQATTAGLTKQQQILLQSRMGMTAFAGSAGSAQFAVLSLGMGLQDASQFGMGFAQGLRAVTNNAQMAVQSFMMLSAQAGSGTKAMHAFWGAMKGPAGFLLAFSAISALIEGIANATQGAKKQVDDLRTAFDDLMSVDGPDIMGFAIPLESARLLAADLRAELEAVNATWFKVMRVMQMVPGLGPGVSSSPQMEALASMLGAVDESVRKQDQAATVARLLEDRLNALGLAYSRVEEDADGAAKGSKSFADSVTETRLEYERLIAALSDGTLDGISSWASVAQERIGELFKEIERGVRLGADVAALRTELRGLMNDVGGGIVPVPAAGGRRLSDKPPTELRAPTGFGDDLKKQEEAYNRVRYALSDGINQELERTQILLNTMPLSVVDGLASAIGESAGQLLTLQGGLKDIGQNLVRVFQQLVAEMAAAIVKQKMLNALQARGGAGGGAQSLATMAGSVSLGTVFGIAAGVGIISALFGSGRRSGPLTSLPTTQIGASNGPMRSNLSVQSTVLRSGDLRLSVVNANAVQARLGQV